MATLTRTAKRPRDTPTLRGRFCIEPAGETPAVGAVGLSDRWVPKRSPRPNCEVSLRWRARLNGALFHEKHFQCSIILLGRTGPAMQRRRSGGRATGDAGLRRRHNRIILRGV